MIENRAELQAATAEFLRRALEDHHDAPAVTVDATLTRLPDEKSLSYLTAVRTIDVVVSATALVLLAPLILVSALIVKIDTKGPAFFRQTRLGKKARPFQIIKLRGMYHDARQRFPEYYNYSYSLEEAHGLHFHVKNDPRTTRVGRVFRTRSIDELPNFWNVLRGDMSLVGPRPQIPEMFDYYGDYEEVILSVNPGIFSLPKVSFRDDLPLLKTMVLDAYYVHHRSLRLDMKIILRGIRVVLRLKGVYY